MARLVALDLPGGPTFVDTLKRAWDAGDAVTVVPQRLSSTARAERLALLRPHQVIGPEGEARTFDADAPLLDEGDALVATSSGSTGTPKVLVHTIAGLAAHASAVHRRLAIDPSSDGWLACLPLDHLGGFGVVARAILDDIRLEVLPAFDAPTVAAAPRDLGTTLTSLVPTALDRVDPAPFRWIVLGGSADPTARPANVVRTYGLTETGGGVVYDRQPLDGVEVRVVDDAIWLRSPTMARGRRDPDGAVAPIVDGDGWLRTGDLGRAGHDGLEVLGRADDLIVTGGENVWPAPVEAVLREHPAIEDVAIVGVADPDWVERVVAVVVPIDPAAPPTLGDLRALVRDRLAPAAAPRELRVVDALPRTSLGKVARADLRQRDRRDPRASGDQ